MAAQAATCQAPSAKALKVAETVLSRRFRDKDAASLRARTRAVLRRSQKGAEKRAGPITPEKMIKNARVRVLDGKRFKRISSRPELPVTKRFVVADSVKVVFAVRNSRSPPSKGSAEVLKRLGLVENFSGVFLVNSEETMRLLFSVVPFVFYGPLSKEVTYRLFSKLLHLAPSHSDELPPESAACRTSSAPSKGVVRSKMATPAESSLIVSDNQEVEKRFGHLGCLTILDLIDEIHSGSSACKQLLVQIRPFQLNSIAKAEGCDAKILESGQLSSNDMSAKVSRIL